VVYIDNGFKYLQKKTVNILEIGFGTGLNCLLTLNACQSNLNPKIVTYTAIEPFPLDIKLVNQLNYADFFKEQHLQHVFHQIHELPFNLQISIVQDFLFSKIDSTVQNYEVRNEAFDLIYFDAFGPALQPEMWTPEIFKKMFDLLKHGGLLVTYCAKGAVKRNLKSVGFTLESLPGPPGKREVTRAIKM
jgi:tRNA U34 5-methylaminomethyl-2-thiouridine-forming methyltransferase MnmC